MWAIGLYAIYGLNRHGPLCAKMYDFKQLSPADFEELTCDLLQKEWRLRIESFKSGRDNGIDLRYAKVDSQPTIVQCKRYVDSTFSRLLNDLRKNELSKIRKLKPKRYVLVTALPLSPDNKTKIKTSLKPFVKRTSDMLGSDEVNSLLRKHKEVETAHYKLWLSSTAVLDRVLHNAFACTNRFRRRVSNMRGLRKVPGPQAMAIY